MPEIGYVSRDTALTILCDILRSQRLALEVAKRANDVVGLDPDEYRRIRAAMVFLARHSLIALEDLVSYVESDG